MRDIGLRTLVLGSCLAISGCGSDAENTAPGPEVKPVQETTTAPTSSSAPTTPSKPQTSGSTQSAPASGPGNTVKRIDPGNALRLLDLPPNEYSQDVQSFIQNMNVQSFLSFQGLIEPARIGTTIENLKYTQASRDNKTRYLKSLKQTHPVPFFKEKSLNALFVLTAITDAARRTYDYLYEEDQNKIQLELTEVARDNTHVALRMIKTFIVPNVGKPFDGGVLMIQPNKTGNNAWLIKDTVVETSLSFLEKDGKVMALAFKGQSRANKPIEAIFEVGAAP